MEFPPPGNFKWSASQKHLRKQAQFIRATPKEEEIARPNAKQAKRLTVIGDKILHNITPMSKDILQPLDR
eukprot:7121424-Ditylum_brightwellii.AAC.1